MLALCHLTCISVFSVHCYKVCLHFPHDLLSYVQHGLHLCCLYRSRHYRGGLCNMTPICVVCTDPDMAGDPGNPVPKKGRFADVDSKGTRQISSVPMAALPRKDTPPSSMRSGQRANSTGGVESAAVSRWTGRPSSTQIPQCGERRCAVTLNERDGDQLAPMQTPHHSPIP